MLPGSSHSMKSYRSMKKSSYSRRNEEVDWQGLNEKFLELHSYLSAPTLSFSNSVEERKKQRDNIEMGLEAIIEVSLSESTILYQDGNLKKAYKGALKTLEFVQKLHGTSSIEQIEVYFLLAKVVQSMRKFKKAEEFLSIAQWTIIRNQKVSSHLRAQLHQIFGLLYIQKGDFDKAVDHLSKSIYYLALDHGSNSIFTSFGCFNLANLFAAHDLMDSAIEALDQVTNVWDEQLQIALKNSTQKKKRPCELSKVEDEKIIEANRMFEQILNIIIDKYSENSLHTAKVFKVIGLYQSFMHESDKAKECLEKAISIMKYVLGDTHKDIIKVQKLLELVEIAKENEKDEKIIL